MLKNKIVKLVIYNKTFIIVQERPPIFATVETFLNPFVAKNVIESINKIPINPRVCVFFKPKMLQLFVLSSPNKKQERGTHVLADIPVNQTNTA